MNAAQIGLFTALGGVALAFVYAWVRAAKTHPDVRGPTLRELGIGVVTDFLDALGIGSFAPTTAIFKLWRVVPDELIPGTLNIGHTTSAVAEALIMVTAILVDPWLLAAVVTSASLGAWLGAGVVARLPRRAIQATMGVALTIACVVFASKNLQLLPGGGTAMALEGWRFVVAVGVNFVLGALMSAGIGLYAPCMVLLALLGMHPIAAFPIMMGACALLQPIAGLRFFSTGKFAWGASLGLAFGGLVGVFVATYIVKSLDLVVLRWGVVAVVGYTAITMLSAARRGSG